MARSKATHSTTTGQALSVTATDPISVSFLQSKALPNNLIPYEDLPEDLECIQHLLKVLRFLAIHLLLVITGFHCNLILMMVTNLRVSVRKLDWQLVITEKATCSDLPLLPVRQKEDALFYYVKHP